MDETDDATEWQRRYDESVARETASVDADGASGAQFAAMEASGCLPGWVGAIASVSTAAVAFIRRIARRSRTQRDAAGSAELPYAGGALRSRWWLHRARRAGNRIGLFDCPNYGPRMHIESVAIIVNDYDAAIVFFTDALGFELIEDSPSLTNGGRPKRWVVVRPPGATTAVLLAQADGDRQSAAVAN